MVPDSPSASPPSASPPSAQLPVEEALARALTARLGTPIGHLRRLTGGASRTTWAFEAGPGPGEAGRPLVLQVARPEGPAGHMALEAALIAAAGRAGVPVAPVVASGRDDGFGAGWMILDRLDGETIPRKLLRDPEYAGARASLVGQCARALAALHRLTPADLPGLAGGDQLAQFGEVLHALGTPRPALELALRRLDATRPSEGAPTVVHGDFRTGNLLVDRQGLRAVLDWELAHVGDPLEDLGWFCVRAWRFGSAGRAGGFGSDDALVTEYERAGGRSVDRTALRWWEAVGTFKWAVMCMLQAASHRSGGRRSVELAAVGRRVCENEWDLLHLLDVSPPDESPLSAAGPGAVGAEVFGRPTAAELVDAVREFVTTDIMGHTNGRLHFDARVAGNALAMVGRELALGPAVVERAAERLRRLGFDDERSLCRAIVDGACDDRVDEVAGAVAGSVRDQLAVANPRHLLPDG